MTAKILSGTYTAGYTLSPAYSSLTIAGTGRVLGLAGSPGGNVQPYAGGAGGTGVTVATFAPVKNEGTVIGGAGGGGASYYGGAGGAGGAGIAVSRRVSVLNSGGVVIGGAGGAGGEGYNVPAGLGGAGGAGILQLAGGIASCAGGSVTGGAGGKGGAGYFYNGGLGGAGGAGVLEGGAGIVRCGSGVITGGVGGQGGNGSYQDFSAGNGGVGGAGVALNADGTVIVGVGEIAGGAGGAGGPGSGHIAVSPLAGTGGKGGDGVAVQGFGTLNSAGDVVGGMGGLYGGAGGDGAILAGGGSIDNVGTIAGGVGGGEAGVGGAGVRVRGSGYLVNTGAIFGGAGGRGFSDYYGGVYGGSGGVGLDWAAAGSISNSGRIIGGAGGGGGARSDSFSGGNGGAGQMAVTLTGGGQLANQGLILGGVGGAAGGGWGYQVLDHAANGGAGGTGVAMAGGVLVNGSTIKGGAGAAGADGYAYQGDGGSAYGGAGGVGGSGVALTRPGSILNTGRIQGGVGGAGGYGRTANGASGADGAGIVMGGVGGIVTNEGGYIGGGVAIYAGAGGAATVTNFGTLKGSSGVSVEFKSSSDRLIAEAGSTFVGAVAGGGGTLELAGGSGTISGLGGAGTVSGAEGITFAAFGHYVVDAGASFTLAGSNTLTANQGVANYGTLLGALTFGSSTDHLVLGAGSVSGMIAGDGGTVRLAGGQGILTIGPNGGVSGSDSASFSGFGTYAIGAGGAWRTNSFDLSSGQRLISEGALTVSGAIGNAGLIQAELGGRIVVSGAVIADAGTIEALPTSLVYIAGSTLQGGDLVTVGTGRILLNGQSDVLDGSAAAIGLRGRLALTAGGALTVAGSIDLAGQLTMFGGTRLTIAADGATLTGGGKIYLSDSAANLIVGQSAGATLTNDGDRIVGAGDLGGGQLSLINGAGGLISSFGAAGLTIDTGAATVVNAGTIEANHAGVTIASALSSYGKLEAVGATLTLEGAVTGSGAAAILAGGAIVADSAFSENVAFIGGAGSLSLAQSQAYTATISGFSHTGGTSLDLRDIGFVSATEASYGGNASGGVLTVTDGTHTAHISLAGDYVKANLVAASDGHGGTIVTAKAGAFAFAMAGIGGDVAAALASSAPTCSPPASLLARPAS